MHNINHDIIISLWHGQLRFALNEKVSALGASPELRDINSNVVSHVISLLEKEVPGNFFQHKEERTASVLDYLMSNWIQGYLPQNKSYVEKKESDLPGLTSAGRTAYLDVSRGSIRAESDFRRLNQADAFFDFTSSIGVLGFWAKPLFDTADRRPQSERLSYHFVFKVLFDLDEFVVEIQTDGNGKGKVLHLDTEFSSVENYYSFCDLQARAASLFSKYRNLCGRDYKVGPMSPEQRHGQVFLIGEQLLWGALPRALFVISAFHSPAEALSILNKTNAGVKVPVLALRDRVPLSSASAMSRELEFRTDEDFDIIVNLEAQTESGVYPAKARLTLGVNLVGKNKSLVSQQSYLLPAEQWNNLPAKLKSVPGLESLIKRSLELGLSYGERLCTELIPVNGIGPLGFLASKESWIAHLEQKTERFDMAGFEGGDFSVGLLSEGIGPTL